VDTPPNQSSTNGHEFRLDPLTREWVLIVGNRQDRPNLPTEDCPFCPGGLETPGEYDAYAFTNRWPALVSGEPTDFDAIAAAGEMVAPAVGAAEVVLNTPEICSVLIFENRGGEVGATIPHPHGQIYAFGFVPPLQRIEAEVLAEHGCSICADFATESDAERERLVYDSNGWSASVPYAAGYPYEILLTPNDHIGSLNLLTSDSRDGLAAALNTVVESYDRLFDAPMPYMMWIHQETSPATPSPGAHLHIHFAPALRSENVQRYVAAAEVGSRVLSNPLLPETAANHLRDALASK